MPRQRVNSGRRKRDAKDEKREKRDDRRGSREKQHRKSAGRDDAATSGQPLRASTTQPRELQRLLAGIGTPAPAPFKPDPFQLEALAALEFEDVLVTAPTGSGKTWIAREEIRRL